ncbi:MULTISPECIES: carboxy terminal-processing peptidase [Halobacteriovorax]|uniref:Tail-specific protease n=1 Tax=Halobacteriovorax vibrionivorans TaxID=2152716 RepID=A0ABY0IFD8_9BACT|nr:MULTISPECIES: carboxy terminal-processing peptidase [Halobacteriovorax]RZF21300.1 tail-specific protease [Halobacteriovorax vibrionivorans]TGD47942.1 tail-specific protease [Halobacteriovorax sp. Y22]
MHKKLRTTFGLVLGLALLSTPLALHAENGLFSINKDQVLGNRLIEVLEQLHYKKLKVNNDLSKNAFQEFIKKIDFSKQFLYKSDVKKLEKYELLMDDEMRSGNYKLVLDAMKIKVDRINQADELRKKLFKENKFNFRGNEVIELDPEKRHFAKDKSEFEKNWRLTFKQSVMARYISIKEDQEDLKNGKNKKDKDKKEKKSKKKLESEKILTEKEILAKAHEAIDKKYRLYFERLLKERREDYMEIFYNSIGAVFDPHTAYLAPKKKEDFDIDMSGQLEGIGAVLSEDEGYIKVVEIVPGGAAWRQKELEVDDLILAVSEGDSKEEPVDLVGMRVDDAVRYIRGKKGTVVRLHVKKADGTRKTIGITRDVVKIGASFAKSSVLELDGVKGKYGYINVPKFYREFNGTINCTDDVRAEIKRLKKQKVNGIILDLRNNGGGALTDAQLMSGLFIKKGPIVQTKNYMHQVETLADTDPEVEYDGPLIVMVNRYSASASEILAAAMQDYKRAVVVGGEVTHGKGTVQVVYNLDQGLDKMLGEKFGALKLTIQKFYRITGGSTQYKGVTPDIVIPDPMAYAENREQDLTYSLKWDQIKPKKFQKWTKHQYDLKKLISNSKKRVAKNDRLQKVQESVDYLRKRRKDTKLKLNIDSWMKEEEANKKKLEELKLDEENTKLTITHFEESLKSHETVKKGEEKQWKDDFKQRKEEWVSSLRKDAGLEEAIHIMRDMIDQLKK